MLLVQRHHAVGVDHDVAAEAVIKIGGVEGDGVLVGLHVVPLRRVVQHLVHLVVARIELERGGVQAAQVVEKLQGIHAGEAELT